MATGATRDPTDRFDRFFRNYYREEIGALAQRYPNEQRSLYVDYDDLFVFDEDLAEEYVAKPEQMREYAEEALRLYDLPADVKLGQAHVRLRGLSQGRTVDIRDIRVEEDHVGSLIAVQGIVRKATDVRPKVTEAAFECQRCGTMTYIPQTDGGFQEPHECQGCDRQGPFRVNHDQSEFVDSQKIRVQESPEGLRGGETPQAIDVNLEDDTTGQVTAGDHVTVTGVLHIDQVTQGNEKTNVFELYMDGVAVEIEDEEFEDMDISESDVREIVDLSQDPDIYDKMVASVAPAIYGYEEEKLAMILQLFSGVTKELPDGSRIRGDLHMLLIGDPGTGKCVHGDTRVTLGDGRRVPIRELVESNLDDPKPVDDGVWDAVDVELPSLTREGSMETKRATKVWRREAPGTLYRVRTSGGTELEVTPSHPLFVADGGGFSPTRADEITVGARVATASRAAGHRLTTDGGVRSRRSATDRIGEGTDEVGTERVESIERVDHDEEWVYDLEVAGTHSYVSNGVVSHNSQMLSYIEEIAPRSVYTSGKGSSAAGLTAAAVRDDFGDGQQWTLEAGALVLADKGIAAVDELDKMSCVTGDTLVALGDGRVERIDRVARAAAAEGDIESLSNGRRVRDVDLDVWTMCEDGRLRKRPVSVVHEYDAPETLTEVTLETGESVTATDDHPFFVLEEGERAEREAGALSPGDWVYVPRELPAAASDGGAVADDGGVAGDGAASGDAAAESDDGVDPATASVLGYLSGDGNVYYDRAEGSYGVRFTNADEELLADFERAAEAAFDATATRPPSERRADGVETVRVHGKTAADAVLDAGMNLGRYNEKAFPTAVSAGSRAAKAAFVRALADSEGTVDESGGNVRLFSASRELLAGTRTLLLGFGVSSQLQHREREDGRDRYVLAVTDAESLAAFARRIGFTASRKADALDRVVDDADGDWTALDVIPEIGDRLGEWRESLRLHGSECGLPVGTYHDFERGRANVPLGRAGRILEAFSARREEAVTDCEGLADAELGWDALETLTERYHVAQSELATGTEWTQQAVSRAWGTNEDLRRMVGERLESIVGDVATTDFSSLRRLARGDVKWRRIDSVERVPAASDPPRNGVLRQRLVDRIGGDPETVVERAEALLERDPTAATDLSAVREALETHGVSQAAVASRLGVDQSTVSRRLSGAVDGDGSVRTAALAEIETVRETLRSLLDRIEAARIPKVYDLTVEETHNFVADGMVVHNSDDRSAMHEALEQQTISIAKAGINATLKSRCSLLGAANPKYGRFDQYEPIGEQIDLEPALISRFDLIFTVTDQPDPEHDSRLAEYILKTNYAGELNTQHEELATSEYSSEEVEAVTDQVAPEIDPDLLRKYVAHAKREVYPTMTDEARATIEEFYVDLRSKGADEDAPVPVTARKLEAMVRLAEASARVRLSDAVEAEDADRAVEITRSCLEDIGVDPETGEFDADVVETGTSKTQRDRIQNLKGLIAEIESEYEDGAPVEEVVDRADEIGIDPGRAEDEIEKLRRKGEVYEPAQGHLRTT